MFVRLWFAVLFSATIVLGSGTEPDPYSNLRPQNITGLMYYLYGWTGSYYNGTTTIRIEPKDYKEDDDCDTFLSGPVEVSYDSLLAIVKSNLYVPEQNPLTFALHMWDRSLNITPPTNTGMGPINDIIHIESVRLSRFEKPTIYDTPEWDLTSTHISDTSYAFSGYRNDSSYFQPLWFNYSQCSNLSSTKYGGSIQEPREWSRYIDDLNVTDYPRVSGRFDRNVASFEITGTFKGNSFPETGNVSYLGGPITISFVGTLDGNRSDSLMTSSNGTPIWNETLGYSKTMYGESVSNAIRQRVLDVRAYFFCLLCVLLWIL